MDSATDPVSMRVVEAVARSRGTHFTELPSLYETVDPDALDALFSKRSDGLPPGENGVEVSFTYAGCEVIVGSNGEVDVRRRIAEVSEPVSE